MKLTKKQIIKGASGFVAMWLLPGPIVIPIILVLYYRWKKKKRISDQAN